MSRSTSNDIDKIADFFVMPEWQRLKLAALEVFAVFEKRRKLAEYEETTSKDRPFKSR